ncbi:MAG: hypothetical protein J6R45_06310 [Clostridia bacterium]|nr:hypothetical protein [Clostridia bacterium]MBO5786920.1 hypothetical protein [Clostridia bacterium]
MKKPFLLLKSRGDGIRLALFFVFGLAASALFFIPENDMHVFANGGESGLRGLFNIISGWLL